MLKLILFFFLILTSTLLTQETIDEQSQKKKILVSKFDSVDSPIPAIELKISEKILSSLQKSNLQISQATASSLDTRLSEAKDRNFSYLVEGFYKKNQSSGNLNLYLQIYDSNTIL